MPFVSDTTPALPMKVMQKGFRVHCGDEGS